MEKAQKRTGPKLKEDKPRSDFLGLRLTVDTKESMRESAQKRGLNLSDYLINLHRESAESQAA